LKDKAKAIKIILLILLMVSMGWVGYITSIRGGLDLREAVAKYENYESSLRQFDLTVTDSPANPQIMVIGDSHAMTLQYGLIQYFGNTVAVSWGPACIPFYGVDRFDGRFKPGTCSGMMKSGFNQVEKSSSINAVVIHSMGPINLTGEVFNDPDLSRVKGLRISLENHPNLKDFYSIYEIGMTETLSRLSKLGKSIFFVIDVPELGFDPHTCLSKQRTFFTSHKREVCAVSRSEYNQRVQQYKQLVYKVASHFPDVVVIDPADVLCDKDWCWAKKDGVILYHDIDHLSNAGSKLVGQQIRRAITSKPALVKKLGLNTPVDISVSFGSRENKLPSPALISGWGVPEDWGVWSVGRNSSLILPLPPMKLGTIHQDKKYSRVFDLVLDVRALVNEKHPNVDLDMSINDGSLLINSSLSKPDKNLITIPITQEMASLGYVKVDFRFNHPVSPKEIGMDSDDSRQLSIALKSAIFQ